MVDSVFSCVYERREVDHHSLGWSRSRGERPAVIAAPRSIPERAAARNASARPRDPRVSLSAEPGVPARALYSARLEAFVPARR